MEAIVVFKDLATDALLVDEEVGSVCQGRITHRKARGEVGCDRSEELLELIDTVRAALHRESLWIE
ncbi:hypothetical protein D3C73_946090 [compost metagenome]